MSASISPISSYRHPAMMMQEEDYLGQLSPQSWNSKKKRRVQDDDDGDMIVELDVGGTLFKTTRDTFLNSGSPFFQNLLEHRKAALPHQDGCLRTKEGHLFIDRNPNLFKHILEYLRTCLYIPVEEGNKHMLRKALREEAMFYQLDGLVAALTRGGLCLGYDASRLSLKDFEVRKVEQEVRSQMLQGDHKWGNLQLVPLFIGPNQTSLPCLRQDLMRCPATSPDATVLFTKQAEVALEHRGAQRIASSLREFKDRFYSFAGPLFPRDILEHEELIVAGGSVLLSLIDPATECLSSYDERHLNSDIDLFITTTSEGAGEELFYSLVRHFTDISNRLAADHHVQLLVMRSALAITFCMGGCLEEDSDEFGGNMPGSSAFQRNIQLVILQHKSIGEVIFNFDLDCCRVAFDGHQVYATPSSLRALQTGMNLFDPEQMSGPDFANRAAKYAHRGFPLAVPGLELRNIRQHYIRNSFFGFDENGDLRRLQVKFSRYNPNEDRVPNITLEDGIIEGLPKLLVFATCWGFINQRRLYDLVEVESVLDQWGQHLEDPNAPLGVGNYLLKYQELVRSPVQWRFPCPPHRPPREALASLVQETGTGTDGLKTLSHHRLPQTCFKYLQADTMMGKPARRQVCYDYIPNICLLPGYQHPSTICPNVGNAVLQYPKYLFQDAPGRLTKELEFPLAQAMYQTRRGDKNDIDHAEAIAVWTADAYYGQD